MSRLTLALAVVLVAGGAATVPAQQSTPRGVVADRQIIFRGRVLADDAAGTPLRRARITTVVGGASSNPVFSDELGRFEALVPTSADYTLKIGKPGFAPVALPRSTSSRGADIRLAQGAALTGRVTDRSGQPVVGRMVRLRRVDGVKDAVQPAQLQVETNDLGEYRFGNLSAGGYAVGPVSATTFVVPSRNEPGARADLAPLTAVPSSKDVNVNLRRGEESFVVHEMESSVVSVVFTSTATGISTVSATTGALTIGQGGVVTGVVTDEFGEPVEGVDVDVWQIKREAGRSVLGPGATRRRTDDRGRYRIFGIPPGTYYVVVTTERTTNTDAEPALVFYPGRAGVTDAVPLPIQGGTEVSGIDLVLQGVPSVSVYGVVLDASGQPTVGNVLLSLMLSSEPVAIPSRSVSIGADGRFELLNVAHGDYVLHAVGKGSADHREFGMQAVTVAGLDVGPMVISTLPGSTVKGTVTLEGTLSSPPVPPSRVGLSMIPAAPEYVPAATAYTGGFFERDWTFEMVGLTGSARFGLESAPANWWLKSVIIDATNAADDPVMFGTDRQSRESVSVVIGTNAAGIRGRVVVPTDGKQPRNSYSVAVFAVDSDRWYYKSRYTKATSVGLNGSFAVSGLPPGEYLAVAVAASLTDGSEGDWQSPELLKRLAPSARRVRLLEGQRPTLELRPVSLPR